MTESAAVDISRTSKRYPLPCMRCKGKGHAWVSQAPQFVGPDVYIDDHYGLRDLCPECLGTGVRNAFCVDGGNQ